MVPFVGAYHVSGSVLGTLHKLSHPTLPEHIVDPFHNVGNREEAAVKSVGVGVRLSGFKPWPCHLLCNVG
jgi:hypothetical protein